MGMRIPSVRGVTQPSDGSGRGTSSALAPPSSFQFPRTPFPPLLMYRANPGGLAKVGGRPSRRWGGALREGRGSTFAEMGGRPSRRSAIGHDNEHRIFKAPVFLLLIIRPLERSSRASPVARPDKGHSGMAAVVCRRRGNRPTLSETRSPTRPDIGYRQEKEKRPRSPVHGLPTGRVRPPSTHPFPERKAASGQGISGKRNRLPRKPYSPPRGEYDII